MHQKHRTLRAKIALLLLIALATRSLVAAGWMLQAPNAGEGFALALAICPQQSPLVADWLSAGDNTHAHHHHHDDGSTSGSSLRVFDPGCALWAGSAAALGSADTIYPTPIDVSQGFPDRVDSVLVKQQRRDHPARAPPQPS